MTRIDILFLIISIAFVILSLWVWFFGSCEYHIKYGTITNLPSRCIAELNKEVEND